MICPACDGKGMRYDGFQNLYRTCEKCDGSGIAEPLTNEEWLRQASTEELAKEIYRLVWLENELFHGLELVEDFSRKKDLEIVTEWLKEKHE